MYDLMGDLIQIGDLVSVPSPNVTDIHNHEFDGTVVGFHSFASEGSFVTVADMDGNCFDIEPDRLLLVY